MNKSAQTFVCHPQLEAHSVFMRDLTLCQLRLQNQKDVPWFILVPKRADMTEIYQLAEEDRHQLMNEITMTSRALDKLFAPDKINVAALGNVVPQLHVHVIARFKDDPAWPSPVWGKIEPTPYTVKAIELVQDRLGEPSLWR